MNKYSFDKANKCLLHVKPIIAPCNLETEFREKWTFIRA